MNGLILCAHCKRWTAQVVAVGERWRAACSDQDCLAAGPVCPTRTAAIEAWRGSGLEPRTRPAEALVGGRNAPASWSRSDEKRREALLECVQSGLGLQQAAKLCGVRRDSLDKWIEAAEKGDPIWGPWYLDLLDHLRRSVLQVMAQLRRAGKRDWRALVAWLEKAHPEAFGRASTKIDSTNTTIVQFTTEFFTELGNLPAIGVDQYDDLVQLGGMSAMIDMDE